jgi:hypothetical protein
MNSGISRNKAAAHGDEASHAAYPATLFEEGHMATDNSITAPTISPPDHHAILARAEQMIDLLRTCYICDGWHGKGLDEVAAERMLQYFRRLADGAPEDDQDPEWEAAVAFVGDHGQSLDWILLGDPSGLICLGAAHSARAEVRK